MLSNEQLYGRKMPPISKFEANYRIAILKLRLRSLTSIHYMKQDTNTIGKVLEGIKFWSRLRDGEDDIIIQGIM